MIDLTQPQDLRGKTVEIEDTGRGTIMHNTEDFVYIMLDPPGCRILVVPLGALDPNMEGETI